jgi:hypothetical protein
MRRLGLLAGIAAASGACGSTSHAGYVLVTVDARPAVHDAAAITVTLANAGTMRSDTLMLAGKSFPVTFSVSAPGRTGDLVITVDASDASGLVIGHGSAMTSVAAAAADVLLDSTDFVVNTDYAGDQFPTDGFQAAGFQLAALPDGTLTTVFRDSCQQSACNVFARRFDRTGKPVSTQAAAGSNAFVVTARASDNLTEPAVASSQTGTAVVWNFSDPTANGIACRTLSATGALGADQIPISTNETLPDALAVAALSTGDFLVAWNALASNNVIRMALVKPDCNPSGVAQTVSPTNMFADRNAIGTSDDHALLTWVISGDLWARTASSTATLSSPAAAPLISQTATDKIGYARIAAAPKGRFALAVRWTAQSNDMAPGKIELYQVTAAGALIGSPVIVTDQSGSNFYDDEGFGLASRPDGTVMIAWHVCNSNGDGCSLSGRTLHLTEPIDDPVATPAATAVSDAFAIPTTTGGSDKLASVIGLPDAFAVVWSDSSGKPPDTAGQAVRARIIYPPGS